MSKLMSLWIALALLVMIPGQAAAGPVEDALEEVDNTLNPNDGGNCNGVVDDNCKCHDGTIDCEEGELCRAYAAGWCLVG